MLGLNRSDTSVALGMITSAEQLAGYEITAVKGVVEGISERSFSSVSVGGVGMTSGGGLEELVSEAKDRLARAAGELQANAVVSMRYTSTGRSLEKSVIAYGTAVICRKL